ACLPTAAWAEVRFEARASSENVTLEQPVKVTVTIERDGTQALEGYRPPSGIDFDMMHTSNSEQIHQTVINGRQSVRLVEQHLYMFMPKKKGNLAINPAVLKVGGQEFKTKAFSIHVSPTPKGPHAQVPTGPALPSTAPPPESLRGDED